MTTYAILARVTDTHEREAWHQFTAQVASSPRAAIRQALAGEDNTFGDGEYIAVPARSWRPVSVKTETRTEVRLS